MRFFRRGKNYHGGNDEAIRAKREAEQSLADAKGHSSEVDQVVGALREHYEQNHMAEAILKSMTLKKTRGIRRLRHT